MSSHYDSIHHSHGQHYGYPHATVFYTSMKIMKVVSLQLQRKHESRKRFCWCFHRTSCIHIKRCCHQRNTLEYSIMVDVKTHMCFPTNIHEIKMNMNKNDKKI